MHVHFSKLHSVNMQEKPKGLYDDTLFLGLKRTQNVDAVCFGRISLPSVYR